MATTADPNPWDFDLEPGGDFVLAPDGGLAIVTGWKKVRQRIMRRLFTNPAMTLASGATVPPDYIFHPDYGVGINRQIDEMISPAFLTTLENTITQGVLTDESVDISRPPDITFSVFQNEIYVMVTVYLIEQVEGQPLIFSVAK